MKLQGWQSLLVVTVLFTVFLIGIFWGRTSAGHQLPSSDEGQSSSADPAESFNLDDTRSFIDGKININRAGIEELTLLPGIGETTAQKIINYRTTNGPFTNVGDLTNVEGIGDSRLNKLKNYITIGG